MTVVDLIDEFRVTYDLGSLGLAGFEDDEIKRLLQKNQYKAINQKVGGNNAYGQKFPETGKRIDDLQNLLRESTVNSGSIAFIKEIIIITIPDDYLHMVSLSLISYETGSYGSFHDEATRIDYSQLPRFQNSKKNEGVYVKNPVYIFHDSGFIKMYIDPIYAAEHDNSDISMIYISKPVMDMNTVADSTELTDFNDDVYYEIVEMTVNEAISIATPGKSQVSNQQLNKME